MSYQYTIRYRSTKMHGNADALSRLPAGEDTDFDKTEESCYWLGAEYQEQLGNFPIKACKVAEETQKDILLKQVLQYTIGGWPEKCPNEQLRPFFNRRFNITVHSGVLLLKSDHVRVVVPASLQAAVLKMLHEGHWGIVRMKQMARRHCWWHKIDKAIEELTYACVVCQASQPNPPRQFQSWPTPDTPWERVHIDFAGPFCNSMWLLVIDAYSNYPYITRMDSITSKAVISALKDIFLIEGPPKTLVSDNGRQFVSEEFESFCSKAGIGHLTTAPFHPASNGEAERWVRTFKVAMKKALMEGRNKTDALNVLLFSYRTAPNAQGKSPSELLHGRQPRTTLALLLPSSTEKAAGKPRFEVGDQLYVKFFTGIPWQLGTVINIRGQMMYQLDTDRGRVWRHQNQLRKVKMPVSILRPTQNLAQPSEMEWLSTAAPTHQAAEDQTQEQESPPPQPPREEEPTTSPRISSPRNVTFHPSVLRRSDRIRRPPKRYPEREV
ncbi:Integrase core domain [Nesidiocoris tenuis]|nr:Integrase core domain [Nesidiocoris tenuis]